jgi:hypothetical protein
VPLLRWLAADAGPAGSELPADNGVVFRELSFTLDDGSCRPVRVVAPGYTTVLHEHDYGAARGPFDGNTTNPTITSDVKWVQKFQ